MEICKTVKYCRKYSSKHLTSRDKCMHRTHSVHHKNMQIGHAAYLVVVCTIPISSSRFEAISEKSGLPFRALRRLASMVGMALPDDMGPLLAPGNPDPE